MVPVTLVNYGLGNIKAFAHIYDRLNIPVRIASTPEELASAEKIILPGVGAFDWAMMRLNKSGLREALDKRVLADKVPVLGVCVGMQMMGKRSAEGKLPGLGWIDAEVVHFHSIRNTGAPLPHMGWNDVSPKTTGCIFKGINNPRYYFLHSYCVVPQDSSSVLAVTDYGCTFAAAVRREHIFGTQFHPEKSHTWGIQLLRNFAEI